eukprot:scaffold227268_cov56-Attheya_sp.AAC.1
MSSGLVGSACYLRVTCAVPSLYSRESGGPMHYRSVVATPKTGAHTGTSAAPNNQSKVEKQEIA